MSFLANRVTQLQPSPTLSVATKAAELRAAGRDVIGLGAGEPDFDTPEHIVEAGVKALRDGRTRYVPVPGLPALREAICAKFERENGLKYTPDLVNVGCGGKQVIYNAMMATLNAGDEVVIAAPFWVSYSAIVEICGATQVIVSCPMEQGFKLSPEALEAAITDRTKWLFLNSPSNPSGAGYTPAELRGLCEVVMRHPKVHIMCDDIYEHLVYDGFEFATAAQVAPELFDRTLTVNGLSKAYCMTGWRVGYAAGPKAIIGAMNKLQSQSTSHTAAVSQYAGVAALNGPQDFIAAHNTVFAERRDMVLGLLNDIDGIQALKPNGAFYIYPSCAGLMGKRTPDGRTIATDSEFVGWMLEAQGVATVLGSAFGCSPHFRISYATDSATLREACARIRRAAEALT